MAAANLLHEKIFVNQSQADDDMCYYQTVKAGGVVRTTTTEYSSETSSILQQIADARKQIQNSLNGVQQPVTSTSEISNELEKLKSENKTLTKNYNELKEITNELVKRVLALEERLSSTSSSTVKAVTEKTEVKDDEEEEDDDFELFGDEDDEENNAEAEKIKQERIANYNEKKSKKVSIVAKSNVILDIKPWDDETDLVEMEKFVRAITMDGLLWGASKQVPLAYGIKKLQISTVIVDEKVSVDLLEELICANEDFVQSVDIAAFNKI